MNTHTNTLVRVASLITGSAAVLGSLLVAAPAFANYNGNNYNPGVGVGNVCTSRYDPFCMIKEGNYLTTSPYNNYSYTNYNQYNSYQEPYYNNYNYTPSYSYTSNTYNPYQYSYNTPSYSYQYGYSYQYQNPSSYSYNYPSYDNENYGYSY